MGKDILQPREEKLAPVLCIPFQEEPNAFKSRNWELIITASDEQIRQRGAKLHKSEH